MSKKARFNRRQFLKITGAMGAALTLPSISFGSSPDSGRFSPLKPRKVPKPLGPLLPQPPNANPIVLENTRKGTQDWVPTNPITGEGQIEGFASATSVDQGDSIRVFVNTPDPSFTLEVFRLGWYGGLGGRRMTDPVTLGGVQQPIPAPDPRTGLIECNWSQSYTLRIPSGRHRHDYDDAREDWVSGVYVILLTASVTGKQSLIKFVVRDDSRFSHLLFQQSATTDQAYNNWGGKSLYSFNSTAGEPAVKVSFNRPFGKDSIGAGFFFSWEFQMMRFLEREGYDVTYCTNIDIHSNFFLLLRHRGFLSVGHDEYWSFQMRQNVTWARDLGINLGFFSANSCYWQARLERSPITGQSNRTMVGYKQRFAEDPLFGVNDALVTARWRDPPVNRPEEKLLGVMTDWFQVNADLVVDDASHWIFAGTGLNTGDRIAGLVGFEADRIFGNGPDNLTRLCHSPVADADGRTGFADMTIYRARSGALVFATGSIQFAWGLDDGDGTSNPALVNPAAQQMTRNLFARFR
jgi:hypothetical protein